MKIFHKVKGAQNEIKHIYFSYFFSSLISAQDDLKFELSPGKFLLVKGYTLKEDTLVARSPEKEKEIALFQNKFLLTLDENDFLKKQDTLNLQQISIMKNVLSRKDLIITKQDSLIIQLEKIAKPESGFVGDV